MANDREAKEANTPTAGYGRVVVEPSGSDWGVTDDVSDAVAADVPEFTGSDATLTHVSVGKRAWRRMPPKE